MAKPLISDELWEEITPLLPKHPSKPKGGRPRLCDRKALTGILFILKSGLPWEMLPHEMGCGSGMTCWRRLRDWMEAGVWDELHALLLERLQQADQLNWSRVSMDLSHVSAPPTNKGIGNRESVLSEPGQTEYQAAVDRRMHPPVVERSAALGKHP